MESLPTLPRRSWSERSSLSLAVAITVVGSAGLLGWLVRIDELLQPFPGLPAMKANIAAAVAVLGMVLLALELGQRKWCQLALIPAVVGVITLGEHFLHLKRVFFDEFIVADFLFDGGAGGSGRMSVMVAICLVLGGITLAWRATERGAVARLFAEAVAGSLITSVGFSTLLG